MGSGSSPVTPTVTLRELLSRQKMPECIDMVDIDIQGNEYPMWKGTPGLFRGNSTIELLTLRAKRVHIGTHSFSIYDNNALRSLFTSRGWKVVWDFGKCKACRARGMLKTPMGTVMFGDGVLA